jgi:predicted RNase H-like HicB family nuclease
MADPKTYTISIKWAGNLETNTEVWLAEIPVFGTGVTVHGTTRQQAVTNAQTVITSAIYAYEQQGLTVPEEAGGF